MESRSSAITATLEAYKNRGETRTETLEYKGQLVPFEVIRVSTNIPLLNHNNSRLRAQLIAHPDREVVAKDPSSDSSQEILASLLARTEKFNDLKDELRQGQRHPGVITRDGMLVNGNTRLVALRQIGAPAIDVAVLPENAVSEDFLSIELSLQMKKYTHQDYTYTNRLLLHRNLSEHVGNETAIFEALGWQKQGPKRLAESLRRLALIEEIMGATGVGYSDFDSKEELIKNLDESYQQRLAEDPASAEQLKWGRVFAMHLGLTKDEVRNVDSDFFDEHLQKRLEDNEAGEFLKNFTTQKDTDGLDALLGANETKAGIDIKRVVKAVSEIVEDDSSGSVRGANLLGELYKQSKAAAQGIIQETVAEKLRVSPIENLRDVTEKLRKMTNELPMVFSDPEFDRGKFNYQARKTQKVLQELQSELERQIELSED